MKNLALIVFFISACQTIPEPGAVKPPKEYARLFDQCSQKNSWFEIHFYNENGLLLTAELDWSAKNRGQWTAEMTDPLGSTALRFAYKKGQIKTSGPFSRKLPKVSLSEQGYIEINDQRTSLRPEEIPCFLSFSFDDAWLANLAYWRSEDGQIKAASQFADRRIVYEINSKDKPDFCVTVERHLFLSWHAEEFTWCMQTKNRREAILTVRNGFKIVWFALDQQEAKQ